MITLASAWMVTRESGRLHRSTSGLQPSALGTEARDANRPNVLNQTAPIRVRTGTPASRHPIAKKMSSNRHRSVKYPKDIDLRGHLAGQMSVLALNAAHHVSLLFRAK
jgi:hypothetical protein